MKIVEGRYVVTMDSKRRVIKNGAVVFDGDEIIAVGKSNDLRREYRPEEKLGSKDFVVIPGLVNTHMHLEMSLYRGIGDDMSLMEMNKRVFFPAERNLKASDVYAGAMASLIEMVKNGITTTIHFSLHAEKAAEAIRRMGMRGVVATAMMDRWPSAEEAPLRSTEDVLKENVKLVREWNGAAGGRIKAWFGPYTELLASPELLKKTDELADKYSTGIHIHLAETHEGVEIIRRMHGKRVFEYVYDIGMLGPNVLAAHCCWLSEKEIQIIKKTGVKIVHTPAAEMKISDGVTPVPRLLSEGVCVSVGIDAPSANNCCDLFREAKLAALLHKVTLPLDPELVPAEIAMEMITTNAARALMWDQEIGSLEVAKKADMALVDLRKIHFVPLLDRPKPNVVNQLIYTASGRDVHTVLIGGEKVVENGEVQGVEESKIREMAQNAAERLVKRSGIGDEKIPWRWSRQ